MYEKSLEQAGLTKEQAIIYEVLVKNGPLKAGKIHQKTPFKRGLTYKILEDLVIMELVEKQEKPKKVAIFSPAHPLKLRDLAKDREQKARDAQSALDGVMNQLASDYNLTIQKPSIQFFEGKNGIIDLYEQLLDARKQIDSIEDKGEMGQLIADYAKEFIHKRVNRSIANRVIAPAENKININNPKELRETRFIPTTDFPFRMDIKIAGSLVALVTLQKDHPIGVLIDNQEIAENFRILFEYMWRKTATHPVPSSSPDPKSGFSNEHAIV